MWTRCWPSGTWISVPRHIRHYLANEKHKFLRIQSATILRRFSSWPPACRGRRQGGRRSRLFEQATCQASRGSGSPKKKGATFTNTNTRKNTNTNTNTKSHRRIHANAKPESWVFFRLWWSRHLVQTQLIGIKNFPRKLFLEIYICVQFVGY